MIWSGWNEFITMGGYGLYVWGSVAVTALALVAEITGVRQRRRALFDQSANQVGGNDETAA